MAKAKNPPNALEVTVLVVEGIKKDADAGSFSDTYVKVSLGDDKQHPKQKGKTSVKQNTLVPEFNERFRFNLPSSGGGGGGGGGRQRDQSWSPPKLNVVVWDQDRFVDEFLGMATVSTEAIPPGKATTRWFTLMDKNNQPRRAATSGGKPPRIRLKMERVYAADDRTRTSSVVAAETVAQTGPAAQDAPALAQAEHIADKAKKDEAEARLRAELSRVEVKAGVYQIKVHIIEVSRLKAEDMNNSCDPVVYVMLPHQVTPLLSSPHMWTLYCTVLCCTDHKSRHAPTPGQAETHEGAEGSSLRRL